MLMSGIHSECLAAFGARVNIKSIPFARVPVLKLAYRGVRFDVSFNQQAVLGSTRLLSSFQAEYGQLSDLVRLVKFWVCFFQVLCSLCFGANAESCVSVPGVSQGARYVCTHV
jgi:DNA polymerase sigma